MTPDWSDFFDALVASEDSSWRSVQPSLRNKARELIESWLSGDRKALGDAVKAALQDNRISEKEIVGILSLIALAWEDEITELGDILPDLIRRLGDGELTSDEIAQLAGNWVATHGTKDDTLRTLIKTAAQGNLDKDAVLEALLTWLGKRNPTLVDLVKKALRSAKPVNLRSLVLITASYLIVDELLKKAGPTHEAMVKDLVDAIKKLPAKADQKSPLADVLTALAAEEYAKAAGLVLDGLDIDDHNIVVQALVRVLLTDEPKAAVADFLAGAIQRELGTKITDKQAAALAKTIVEIATGKVKLIPELAEREFYFKKYNIVSEEYEIWVDVRRILYAAKLAVAGGAVVSGDPMARPHVFAAASISPETVVGSLAPADDWQQLIDCIFMFTKRTWGKHPKGQKYLTESPVEMDTLKNKQTARYMLEDVYQAIHLS